MPPAGAACLIQPGVFGIASHLLRVRHPTGEHRAVLSGGRSRQLYRRCQHSGSYTRGCQPLDIPVGKAFGRAPERCHRCATGSGAKPWQARLRLMRAYPSVLAAHAEPGRRRRRLMIIQRLPANSLHETHVIRSSIDVQIQIFLAIGCRGGRQNPAIPLQSRQVRDCPAGVNILNSITRNSLERNAQALSGAWLGQIQHTLRHDVNRDQISRMIFFGTDAGNFGELFMVFRNGPGARERRVQASVLT